MAGPLSHIKVLDLSRILAGPWSGQVLADLGADVVKVERPGVGDDTRSWGPPFLKDADGNETRESGYYLSANRGKRSVTVDLNTAEGQEIVRALAARSDILLENYKVGTLARFGLDYASLKEINPGLIYCSVTGFGQDGPKADHAAYDFMIQAMGGLMSVTGERDDLPGGGPQKVGVPIVDLMTGMYTSVAVLAALARRAETGQGDYIDIGMLDVMVGSVANQGMNYLVSGKTPRRAGNKHPNIQPQDVFACADGHVVLVVGNDGQFARFCDVAGRPEWVADARFASNGARVRNRDALLPLMTALFRERPMQEWAALLDEAGVPCSPINTIPQVFEDAQVRHRGMLMSLPHPSAGAVPQIRSPMRFAEAQLAFDRAPPLLGQHTAEVLAQLGFDEARIARLARDGII
ncbi:CaiB/BaiF CoA-transferase family protein [uncultured Massilia sp.]|uniref:CaiB/BaiF CoA transferase family protein n=1 Tax=uncultured Massilia sp. TaxID=169973 RepID=UPI0025D71F72|nr:CaiB/BaiF CoA-transferase family protein [uncultured Massilia sp.]